MNLTEMRNAYVRAGYPPRRAAQLALDQALPDVDQSDAVEVLASYCFARLSPADIQRLVGLLEEAGDLRGSGRPLAAAVAKHGAKWPPKPPNAATPSAFVGDSAIGRDFASTFPDAARIETQQTVSSVANLAALHPNDDPTLAMDAGSGDADDFLAAYPEARRIRPA